MAALQLWGGIECTINRVGHQWRSQLKQSGHLYRATDLELVAGLGIRTIRYPILWEQFARADTWDPPWRWAMHRLSLLRALGMTPIVGLLHHGSGPRDTSLIDENFATGLAAHAAETAKRFPWVELYTPVNEPLTTARFSGLYGHWYPHGRDDRTFARALINQCRAVVLSMRAVRIVNSRAQLIQTEDLGTTFGTPGMAEQVEFDNHRRWLTWDLLGGRVQKHHPLFQFLLRSGIEAQELGWFADNPCVPQMLGINHYVTSDRFLDENISRYPDNTHGSNGRGCYADVDAVRILRGRYRGWDVLNEVASRYALPMAVTEVHLGCSREEQLRWLEDAWNACEAAQLRGHDVRAVTAWALFGSYDWDSLLTRQAGHYEPGAFDIRSPNPRPTAISQRLGEWAQGGAADGHPVLASDGWWQTGAKLTYGWALDTEAPLDTIGSSRRPLLARQPLVICGTGTLGRALARECERRGLAFKLLGRLELDIRDTRAAEAMLIALHPWGVINAAGYVRVDDAETDVTQCFSDNCDGPASLAALLNGYDVQMMTFSTDLVFDGSKTTPYVESDPVNPLNVYGRSKAAAERAVLANNARTLCIRTAAFFGYWEPSDLLANALDALDSGTHVRSPSDVLVSPTYLPDLVSASLDLFIDRAAGLWHLANPGALSWADFINQAGRLTGVNLGTLEALPVTDLAYRAARPRNSALISQRGWILKPLDDALERFAAIAKSEFLPRQRSLRGKRSRVA